MVTERMAPGSTVENEKSHGWPAVAAHLMLVVSIAILARIGFVYLQKATDPLHLYPVIDEITCQQDAKTLAEASFSMEGMNLPFYQPPGSIFTAALLFFLGFDFEMIIYFQLAIGVINAVLLYCIIHRLTTGSHARWALWAGILFSLCPTVLYYETKLLRPSMGIFLLLIILFLLTSRLGFGTLSLLGITTALLCLFEAYYLVLAMVVAMWLWRKIQFKAIVFIVVFCLLLAPITVLNATAAKRLIPVSGNGGLNLYIGNNPHWMHTYNMLPGWSWRMLSYRYYHIHNKEGSLGIALSEPYYIRDVALYVVHHPLRFLSGLLMKCILSFSCRDLPRNNYLNFRFPLSWWSLVYNGLIVALSIVVLPDLFKKQPVLFFAIILVFMVNIIFFPTSRYRIPLVPLALIAGHVLHRADVVRNYLGMLLGVLFLTVISGIFSGYIVDFNSWKAQHYINIGQKCAAEGNDEKAHEWYQLAHTTKVNPQTSLMLAHFAEQQRDRITAKRFLEEYIRMEPYNPRPYYFLADYEEQAENPNPNILYRYSQAIIICREKASVKDTHYPNPLIKALKYSHTYELDLNQHEKARKTKERLELAKKKNDTYRINTRITPATNH